MRVPWSQKRDIEFVDSSRSIYQHYPVLKAKDVKSRVHDFQKEKYGSYNFPFCPGMIDYSKMGYIIPAWVDTYIMANKAGTVCNIGSSERGNRGFRTPVNMDSTVVDGFINPEDDVPLAAIKLDSPWTIFGNGNISALLLPAVYHSNFLDDLHVWPGVVDYKKFHTCNFIFSPKRKCEIHIKAGEPLLHVIPIWNKDMIAGYGPGTDIQIDSTRNSIPADSKQYYRKNQLINKIFELIKF